MLDARITKRLAAAKGVSMHRGKLRIAFTLPGETSQTKRSLGLLPTVKNIDFAEMKLAEIKMDIIRGTFTWERHFPKTGCGLSSPEIVIGGNVHEEEILGTRDADRRTARRHRSLFFVLQSS